MAQDAFFHAQQFHFGIVGIGDKAALKPCAGARQVGAGSRNHAAGAALGGDQTPFAGEQEFGEAGYVGGTVGAVRGMDAGGGGHGSIINVPLLWDNGRDAKWANGALPAHDDAFDQRLSW
jgi:hypothetical protein